MERTKRSTKKSNIVIVCEGSDTEPAYLTDLKRYIIDKFDDVRIVPFGNEAKEAQQRDSDIKAGLKNSSRKKRTTISPTNEQGKKRNFYWVKEELDSDDYQKYNKQPTRYVREAQLFLEDGYVEAWAVYDYDKFPDHENARSLAKSDDRLHIAFTSVSFEQWLLLHFERNPKSFESSVCKEDKKDIGCGSNGCLHPLNCHGEKCVGGYLREKKFIPNFAKSNNNLYTTYTKDRLNLVRINAAWVRTLQPDKEIHECNPYTDFDSLLARLLNLNDQYVWVGDATSVMIGKVELSIAFDKESSHISLTNISNRSFLSNWMLLDEKAQPVSEPMKLFLSPNTTEDIDITSGSYLIIDCGTSKYVITPTPIV